MTESIISKKDRNKIAKKARAKKYTFENRERLAIYQKQYFRTKDGLIAKIHGHQRLSSKQRGHPMPEYCLDELRAWVNSQSNFNALYNAWVSSGFDTMKRPSCDRLDDYKPYTLDNLRLITWQENKARGHDDRRNGINNKTSKAVLQMNIDDEFIRYYSIKSASRATGADASGIIKCCNGERKTAGGFKWAYA